MADVPLSLRDTLSGTAYVDGPLVAFDWDNTALLDGGHGVLVWGTDDHTRAQVHATEAVQHFFGASAVARPCPGPTRWRLKPCSENRDASEWRPDDTAAEPAVLFTAEEVPSA